MIQVNPPSRKDNTVDRRIMRSGFVWKIFSTRRSLTDTTPTDCSDKFFVSPDNYSNLDSVRLGRSRR